MSASNGDDKVVSSGPMDSEEALAFWTDERLEAAEPQDLPTVDLSQGPIAGETPPPR
jgi:hypothetical protein